MPIMLPAKPPAERTCHWLRASVSEAMRHLLGDALRDEAGVDGIVVEQHADLRGVVSEGIDDQGSLRHTLQAGPLLAEPPMPIPLMSMFALSVVCESGGSRACGGGRERCAPDRGVDEANRPGARSAARDAPPPPLAHHKSKSIRDGSRLVN